MIDKVQKILEDVKRLCNAGLHNSTISKKDVLNTILAVVNDFKEPANEEWIEELRTKLDSLSKEDFEKVWSKYSQYSKEEKSVSDDLEEAAEEWDESLYRSDAFKAGAKWKEQQIMAKAVEGVLTFNHDGRVLFGFIVPDSFCDDVIFKDMDKVKLIIIKKDKDE